MDAHPAQLRLDVPTASETSAHRRKEERRFPGLAVLGTQLWPRRPEAPVHTDVLGRRPRAFSLPHVVKVGEDEGLVDVEAAGDDVLGVLHGVAVGLLQGQLLPEVLLVVRHLDD